jgi:hypothetical protein
MESVHNMYSLTPVRRDLLHGVADKAECTAVAGGEQLQPAGQQPSGGRGLHRHGSPVPGTAHLFLAQPVPSPLPQEVCTYAVCFYLTYSDNLLLFLVDLRSFRDFLSLCHPPPPRGQPMAK